MEAFRPGFDSFHAHTAPADLYEGLVKAYVGDGLAADFYREIAAYLDPDTRDVIISALDDTGQTAFVVERVRAGIAEDPRLGGRLALWGRRLMGEALTQAQRVASQRDALTALLAGGVDRPGLDLAALGRMFARLTENHSAADGRARPRRLDMELAPHLGCGAARRRCGSAGLRPSCWCCGWSRSRRGRPGRPR